MAEEVQGTGPLATPSCEKCRDIPDRQDVPHCIRTCGCGRVMYVHEPGDHGIGIKIREGDRFIIPAGWLKLSFDPRKSTGQFTEKGLLEFAARVFVEEMTDWSKREAMGEEFVKAEAVCIDGLRNSPMLTGFDLNSEADVERVAQCLKDRKDTIEFWYFQEAMFLEFGQHALKNGNASESAWATACAERCRAMRIYKEHLQAVVGMGHSAGRLLNFLRLWDANKANSDETFWQIQLREHPYALSQAFSAPVVLIGERAYVGGQNVEGKNARIVDYLFSIETSRDALLVEIKTPATQLLSSKKYRGGVYAPSRELSGAVVQVLDYRRYLRQNLGSLTADTKHNLDCFNPRCLLLIGNGKTELADTEKRQSFELFRRELKDVEILTFDELFGKVRALTRLFNLIQ